MNTNFKMPKDLTVSHFNAILLSIILAGGTFCGKRFFKKFDTIETNQIETMGRTGILETKVKRNELDITKLEARK